LDSNKAISFCGRLLNSSNRKTIAGSSSELCKAIDNGADLRIYTEFKYGEHIEPGSPNLESVKEVSDFRVTYLIDKRWAAGIMNLRVPALPPKGFGPRMSMSFFMYNQDGSQAIARPYLDRQPALGSKGLCALDDHSAMPKYHQSDSWDANTNAPSSNFIYDFDVYRFFVRNGWREVYFNDADGSVISGSLAELMEAFEQGCEIKVAVQNPWSDIHGNSDSRLSQQLFIHAGPGYYNTEQKLFTIETQPLVRVKPSIPMRYATDNWDFGWFLLRSDGFASYWRCDPYNLKFEIINTRLRTRWFVSSL
jgi:hypothetical protein